MKNKKCAHLHLSSGVVSSRVFREAESVMRLGVFQEVVYYCLWEKGLHLEESNSFGMKIRRIPTLVRKIRSAGFLKNRGLIRKIFAVLSFIELQFKYLRMVYLDKQTHICCHNVQLLPISIFAGFVCRSEVIYAPHELESEVSFISKKTKKLYFLLEKIFLSQCDHVVVVNERIMDWYKDKFNCNSIEFVRNIPSYPPAEFKSEIFNSEFGIQKDELIYIYQGLLGADRGIKEIAITFELIKKAHVVFMGYGEMVDFVLNKCNEHKNIHYKPAVRVSEIISNTSSADVGLIYVCGDLPLSYKFSLPNKFYEYLYSGVPVIVSSCLDYLSELVSKNDIGWVVDCGKLDELINRINHPMVAAKKVNIDRYVSNNTWQEEEKKFIKIYK